jgi:hypothetical protein
MSTARQHNRSELYLLRLWLEDGVDGSPLCCGKLQLAVSGEQHQFRGLTALAELVAEVMRRRTGAALENVVAGLSGEE